MTRLQKAVEEAMPRMWAIDAQLYREFAETPGVVLTEAIFYEGGPVCLVATLPDGRRRTTIKEYYR